MQLQRCFRHGDAVLLFILLFAPMNQQAFAETGTVLEHLMSFDIPDVTTLQPEYPDSKDSTISRFRIQLHKDFSKLIGNETPASDEEILSAYSTVRDTWLKSGTLSKVVLAGYITLAVDTYLLHHLREYSTLTSGQLVKLRDLASRNELPGDTFFVAIDSSLAESARGLKPLSEFCERMQVMPSKPCWRSYLQQFDLTYTEVALEGVTLRFLDAPLKSSPEPLERYAMYGSSAGNPLFVLHVGQPSYVIQFVAQVLDVARLRKIAWEQVERQSESATRSERVAEHSRRLNEFAPAGERWLSMEWYFNEAGLNVEAFYNLISHYQTSRGFSKPVDEVGDALLYRRYMKLSGSGK